MVNFVSGLSNLGAIYAGGHEAYQNIQEQKAREAMQALQLEQARQGISQGAQTFDMNKRLMENNQAIARGTVGAYDRVLNPGGMPGQSPMGQPPQNGVPQNVSIPGAQPMPNAFQPPLARPGLPPVTPVAAPRTKGDFSPHDLYQAALQEAGPDPRPEVVLGIMDGVTKRFQNQPKADLVNILETGKKDPTTFNMADPTQAARANQLISSGAGHEVKDPSSVVNINQPGGEHAYDVAMGQSNAKAYTDIIAGGTQALREAPKIERLNQLLSQVETGAFKGTITDLKTKAKALGIDLDSLGITDDTAPAEAAKALSREQALQLRNPAGGAGMPGAMSDQDRNYLESMIASIDKQPLTNQMLTDLQRKLNKRTQDVAKIANEFTKANKGRFDQALFYDYLAEWSEKHPLFADIAQSQAAAKPDYSQLPKGATVNKDGTVIDAEGNPLVWKP